MEGKGEQLIKVSVVTTGHNVEAVVFRRGQNDMSEQDVDDVAFLTGISEIKQTYGCSYTLSVSGTNVPSSDCPTNIKKKSLYENNGVVVCSQKRALFIAAVTFAILFAISLIIAYTGPQSGKKPSNIPFSFIISFYYL